MARFFIDRPIFAWVIALFVILAGTIAIVQLPIAQYPSIAPPSVVIDASYPGATAAVIDQSITNVIEQELAGAEGLLYVESQSQANGTARITATFRPGTNADLAAVDVQNRLRRVESRLPPEVTRLGLPVTKSTSNFLMVVALTSSDGQLDPVALGDYASRNVINELRRVPGVGQVTLFGSERALRVWIDPARLEGFRLDAADIVEVIRAQNLQIAAGGLGEAPSAAVNATTASIVVSGQLADPVSFGNIRVRANPDGSVVRLADVARIELGAANYNTSARLNGQPVAGLGIQQTPTGNALESSTAVRARMQELVRYFPAGVEYRIPYDTAPFVRLSIEEVIKTLAEAIVLVVLVMFLFLQNWRATLIPTLVVPVALTGTFAIMQALGFSINILVMFGLVLAIGILVDDAIVVIENVERIMVDEKLPPREATVKAMTQITPALVGITLVLVAVFVPMAFFGGAVGSIYRQFSLAMVASISLSLLMALSLTPALCATFLKPREDHQATGRPTGRGFFGAFNRGFLRTRERYVGLVSRMLARSVLAMAAFALLAGLTAYGYLRLPGAFLPAEDQGYLITNAELPPGASTNRTTQVLDQAQQYFGAQPAVANMFAIAGFSFSGSGPNTGLAFVTLKPWHERNLAAEALARQAFGHFMGTVRDAIVFPLNPPPIPALGNSTGFALRLQDRANLGLPALTQARDRLLADAGASQIVTGLRVEGLAAAPQFQLDIDRDKAAAQGLTIADIGTTLAAAFGSTYANDFPNRGRLQRVIVQAEALRRTQPEDLLRLPVRAANGQMVLVSSFAQAQWINAPVQLLRYNSYPAFRISGQAKPGFSSGQAMEEMERLIGALPAGVGFEWTGQSYEERLSGNQAPWLFALSALAVFLCLAALYESWSVPLAVLLVVPLGILGTTLLTTVSGLANDVYFKVGLLTIMGLSAKNAILIVEFAKEANRDGADLVESALQAARLRLRPILMTSLAFMLGVLPLMLASGASAASQRAIGTAVFGGMLTGTLLAIVFVPVFFVVVNRVFAYRRVRRPLARAKPIAAGDARQQR